MPCAEGSLMTASAQRHQGQGWCSAVGSPPLRTPQSNPLDSNSHAGSQSGVPRAATPASHDLGRNAGSGQRAVSLRSSDAGPTRVRTRTLTWMALHDVHRHSGHCPLPTSEREAQIPHPAVAPRVFSGVSLRKVKPWVSPQLRWASLLQGRAERAWGS